MRRRVRGKNSRVRRRDTVSPLAPLSRLVGHGEGSAEAVVHQRTDVGVEATEEGIAVVFPGIILNQQ